MCACSHVLTEIYLKFAKVIPNRAKVFSNYLKQKTKNDFALVSQIQTLFVFIVFPKSKVCKIYLKQKTEKENKSPCHLSRFQSQTGTNGACLKAPAFLSRFVIETRTNGPCLYIYSAAPSPLPKQLETFFYEMVGWGVCQLIFFTYACKVFDEMPERVHKMI